MFADKMGDVWRMGSHMESVIKAYKTLSKIPSIVGGTLNSNGNRIISKWSVRNIDKGKNTRYQIEYFLDKNLDVTNESYFGVDVSNELLVAYSPNETYKAVISEEKDEKDSKKKFFLEIWTMNCLSRSIDLTALDIHGDVYADSEFGCLDWSPDEKKIVYVAEKKVKKSEPYIKRKPAAGTPDDKTVPGEEHLYKEDWGEQLTSKIQGVIVVCDVDSETFTVLDNLPDDWCPGQVRFAPDGKSVVGVAWETGLRRLGLIYCTNRYSFVFSLTLDGVLKKLSQVTYSVRSPRVSPHRVVWLQRYAGGPHHSCHQLVGLTYQQIESMKNVEVEPTIITDLVETERKISNDFFYGIFCQGLPLMCFVKNKQGLKTDDERIVFSTQQQNEIRSYVVHVESGNMVDISHKKDGPGSTTVLCVRSDVVLATFSNLRTPSQLFVARLPPTGHEAGIEWVPVSKPHTLPSSISQGKIQYMHLDHNNDDKVSKFTAMYFGPDQQGIYPLVVWPHGGPHSAFSNTYSLEAAFFNLIGFATLLINYRGSAGTGNGSICYLPSRIGTADVLDCKLATDKAIDMFPVNDKKLLLYGGSHGGFLVAHLSGLFYDFYHAAVLRNPVIDLASMIHTTDIADWCATEAGFEYIEGGQEFEDTLLLLHRASPIIHSHNVIIPTAVMLGTKDKRVPYYQGLEFVRKLKAKGVPTR
nr:acylamino-acid-releasing enzyme-like isoform X3 [Danaus plexippus plexippus]